MYKSKSNIAINLNVLNEQLSKDDYNTLITITLALKFNRLKTQLIIYISQPKQLGRLSKKVF